MQNNLPKFQSKQLKILDMASGCGIFGFFTIEACKAHNYEIERICFCDVDAESLACNYKNCLLNEKNCGNVDWMELRESDLWGGFEGKEEVRFDVITANFPQTPFHTDFKCKYCMFLINIYFIL